MKPIKERPILFSTAMVQAILRGDKTQTRRIIKMPSDYNGGSIDNNGNIGIKYEVTNSTMRRKNCPLGEPGDILWVRETWQHTKVLNLHFTDENYGYIYKADGQPWDDYENWKWKPSLFMPKDAARIWLEIKSVRAERLLSISEDDAWKEGVDFDRSDDLPFPATKNYITGEISELSAKDSFLTLWEFIHGEGSTKKNPWVWVVEFELKELTGGLWEKNRK